MAILSKEINQVVVRIRRHPENTYFDEYIKVGDREKTDATSCDRYIIPELGKMYTIEVTLRRGYNFVNSKSVSAALFLPGVARPISRMVIWPPKDYEIFTDEDIKIELTYAERVKVNGLDISGARLAFRGVSIDEQLENETNIWGVDPKDLGSLCVDVVRQSYDLIQMTPAEQLAEFERQRKEISTSNGNKTHWDAEKVDPENFKKHGITAAVGFVGGHTSQPQKPLYWVANPTQGVPLEFRFHCRPAEFLEQVNIVRYPPPLHTFSWEQLDEDERKVALRKLQEIDKKRAENYEEIDTAPEDWPEEWDPWNTMQPYQRRAAFKRLQQAQKAHQRGEVQNQIAEIPKTRIIDLENDKPGSAKDASSQNARRNPVIILDSPPPVNNNRKRPAESQIHRQSQRAPIVKKNVTNSRTAAPRRPIIKQEPIDVDALGDTELEILPAPTIKYDPVRGDTHAAKRVKFEEDALMDLFLYDEFTAEESQAVDEGEWMAVERPTDQKPITTIEEDSADLEPTEEDEMTVEEKAEMDRIKLETQRTMAAYMEQLRSQM